MTYRMIGRCQERTRYTTIYKGSVVIGILMILFFTHNIEISVIKSSKTAFKV